MNEVKGRIQQSAAVAVPSAKFEGTCFLIDATGYLVTNQHVVKNADAIRVQNIKGTEFKARVVYTDADIDIAVLKIEDVNFKSFPAFHMVSGNHLPTLLNPSILLVSPGKKLFTGKGT